MDVISSTPIPREQIDQLDEFAAAVPAELQELLHSLVASLRDGDQLVAIDPDGTLTPNEAAKHLSMSRTHLYKLLDDGVIPSHRVGRDRRIVQRDVVQFALDRVEDQRELARRFAHQDETRRAAVKEIADLL